MLLFIVASMIFILADLVDIWFVTFQKGPSVSRRALVSEQGMEDQVLQEKTLKYSGIVRICQTSQLHGWLYILLNTIDLFQDLASRALCFAAWFRCFRDPISQAGWARDRLRLSESTVAICCNSQFKVRGCKGQDSKRKMTLDRLKV